MSQKYISCSIERSLIAYPEPKYYAMFQADKMHHFKHGNSKHLQYIIEKYFNSMPDSRQKQLLEEYHAMKLKKKINP